MMEEFTAVESNPYPWPYDGIWSNKDTAVLAIDFQRDLCDEEGFLNVNFYRPINRNSALEKASRVITWARKGAIPIVHTRHVYQKEGINLSSVRAAWNKRLGLAIGETGPLGDFMIQGEGGSEIMESVAPLNDEPLINRPAINPFLHSDLHNLLLKMEIRNLIIIGAFLEGSVHTAVCAANDRGYETLLVSDACPTMSEKAAETVKQTTVLGGGLFGPVSTSETLLATQLGVKSNTLSV